MHDKAAAIAVLLAGSACGRAGSEPVEPIEPAPPGPRAAEPLNIDPRPGCGGSCPGWSQRTMPWHEATVTDVALVRGGVVTVSHDGTLRFWTDELEPRFVRRVETGDEPRLAGHPQSHVVLAVLSGLLWRFDARSGLGVSDTRPLSGRVVDLELRPDGSAVLAFASGRIELRPPQGRPSEFELGQTLTAAATDGGTRMVVGVQDAEFGDLLLVDLASAAVTGPFERGGGIMPPVFDIAFSPDGKQVVTAGYELVLWDVERRTRIDGTRIGQQPSEDAARTPAFALDGSGVDFVAIGGQLARWVFEGNTVDRIPVDTPTVSAARIDGDRIWVGTAQGGIGSVDRKAPTTVSWGPAVGQGVTALAFAPGASLVGGLVDGTLVTWDLGEARERRRAPVHGAEINAIEPMDSATIVTAAEDGVKLVGLADLAVQRVLDPSPTFDIARCDDGTLVLARGDGHVAWLDPSTSTTTHTVQAHDKPVLSVDVTADCMRAVSCSEDGHVRVWSRDAKEPLHTFSPQGRRPLQAVAWLDTDTVLSAEAFLGKDLVRRWSLAEGRELEPLFQTKYGASRIEVRGPLVAISDLTAGVMVWETPDGKPLRFPSFNGNAMALAMSPDGRRVALGTTGNEATVRVWDKDG